MAINVFVSVGTPCTPQQEEFIKQVEGYLRSRGLRPRTVGRSDFTHEAPLGFISKLMNKSAGALVIALERTSILHGISRRGSERQANIEDRAIPTPWNHIEAAFAYARGLPLLVIREEHVIADGMLEPIYDWYVLSARNLDGSILNSKEFSGSLSSWERAVRKRAGWYAFRSE